MKANKMKILITIILTTLACVGFSQNRFDTVQVGETAILQIGEDTEMLRYNGGTSPRVYENAYGVYGANNVHLIPATAPDDTIAIVMATMTNPKDAMLLERGSLRKVPFIVTQSNVYIGSYGSGEKPIIDGADVLIGFTSGVDGVWEKSGVTIEPNIAFLNDVLGVEQASVVACTLEGDWYYDGTLDIFYIYSSTDPSGVVEIGQRIQLFDIGSNDYITIRNLIIQHSNESSTPESEDWNTYALTGTNNSNITIENCTIQDNGFNAVVFSNMTDLLFNNNTVLRSGLQYTSGYNVWIRQTVPDMENIIFTNNVSNSSGGIGFFIRSDSKLNHTSNVEIYGNTFSHNDGAGLYISKLDTAVVYNNHFDGNGHAIDADEDYGIGITSCDYLDVYNNTILNTTTSETLGGDGIQLYSDDNPAYGSANNCRIFNNYIDGVINGSGITASVLGSDNCQNLLIAYNLIVDAEQAGVTYNQQQPGSPSSIDVFNNTIIQCNIGVWANDINPIVVRNNIFYNGSGDAITKHGSAGLTHTNNLYFGHNTAIYYDGVWTSIEDVKTIEPTAQNTDPLFTDEANGDYTLQVGSPAINSGVDVGLTHDILDNPIVGLPDMGAHEKQ